MEAIRSIPTVQKSLACLSITTNLISFGVEPSQAGLDALAMDALRQTAETVTKAANLAKDSLSLLLKLNLLLLSKVMTSMISKLSMDSICPLLCLPSMQLEKAPIDAETLDLNTLELKYLAALGTCNLLPPSTTG